MTATEITIKKLTQSGLVNGTNLNGCTVEEVKKLEDYFEIKLPRVYVNFLMILGKNADNFLKGTDFLYDKLFKLKDFSKILLRENKVEFDLDRQDFVFVSHQGYQFLFFKCDGKDQSIYYYEEGQSIKKVYNNFEKWLEETVNDEIEAMETLRK